MLDIACLKASQRAADAYFLGRNKYRKDGCLSKIYENKQQQFYIRYKEQLKCEELVFLLYMLIQPIIHVSGLSDITHLFTTVINQITTNKFTANCVFNYQSLFYRHIKG